MNAKQYSVSIDQLVYDYGSMVSAICQRRMQDEEAAREKKYILNRTKLL